MAYSAEKWALSLKGCGGGGSHFETNVDLCTIPYGTIGPRGGGSRPPPPGYGPAYGRDSRITDVSQHTLPIAFTGRGYRSKSTPSQCPL